MKFMALRNLTRAVALLAAGSMALASAATPGDPSFGMGRVLGDWRAPTLTMPGHADGVVSDRFGTPRFDLRMSLMPSLHGERPMVWGEIVPIEGALPRNVPHMYVSGYWTDTGRGKGLFRVLVLSDLGLQSDQPALGLITGEFNLYPDLPPGFQARKVPRRDGIDPVPWSRVLPVVPDGLYASMERLGASLGVLPCLKGPDTLALRAKKAPIQPAPANEPELGIFAGTMWLQR